MIGVVFLRAFIFAAVLGGISMLAMKLIEGFIPELLDESDEELDEEASAAYEVEAGGDATEDVSGKRLNITVEDEPDVSYAGEAGEAEELEVLDEQGEIGREETPAAAAAAGAVPGEDDVEELQEVEEAESIPQESAPAEDGGKGKLPDIGAYAESFEQSAPAGGEDLLSSIDGTGSDGTEILGGVHNTQEIVKAVQTVLKKDQEG